jgi:NAD(P)H-hydrate epimerase
VEVYFIGDPEKVSDYFRTNSDRSTEDVNVLRTHGEFPIIDEGNILIDALFGSGLTRPVTGFYAELIHHMNESPGEIISIDIASGLYCDQPLSDEGSVIEPKHTVSFQLPKMAFFQPGQARHVGNWHVVNIKLHPRFMEAQSSDHFLTEEGDVIKLVPRRNRFDHKGNFGRVQLISGSKGKMGASVLAARACLRGGAGLVHVQVPKCGTSILQTAVPEAMVIEDQGEEHITSVLMIDGLSCLGIGPGVGTDKSTAKALIQLLKSLPEEGRLVMDADAINLLSENRTLLSELPNGTVLTPHPGEFRRLVGDWSDDYEKLRKLKELCKTYQLNVVLKGAFSAICNSRGEVRFNPTGNPGMATGGSGDVLFGLLTALIGQGMDPEDALLLGVYIHGLAGDRAKEASGMLSMVAGDLIEKLPEAFKQLDI